MRLILYGKILSLLFPPRSKLQLKDLPSMFIVLCDNLKESAASTSNQQLNNPTKINYFRDLVIFSLYTHEFPSSIFIHTVYNTSQKERARHWYYIRHTIDHFNGVWGEREVFTFSLASQVCSELPHASCLSTVLA